MRIRIGSRQSQLAKWQAHHIAAALERIGCEVEFVWLVTEGDRSNEPLVEAGGVGVFTKAIQRALLEGRCDAAVHSLKDLPTQPVPGLRLAATPPREDPRDCLVSTRFRSLDDLPDAASVGTGSPRRVAQLLRLRPDLQVRSIRGNVDTRLRKLRDGEYDAILLAAAGLHRLGLQENITEYLDPSRMLPAVGQAALGLECRSDDAAAAETLGRLNDSATWHAVAAERAVLRDLQAGCLAPMGVHAAWRGDELHLAARLLSPDGRRCLQSSAACKLPLSPDTDSQGAVREGEHLGIVAAMQLRLAGAEALL